MSKHPVSVHLATELMNSTSIKREQLSSKARNLFGIEHPQSRPMRTFSGVTIEKLLAIPGLGPILDRIIDDGAKLINDSRWSASELVEGQLTLRATEVMLAVEDEMVKAQIWVSHPLFEKKRS